MKTPSPHTLWRLLNGQARGLRYFILLPLALHAADGPTLPNPSFEEPSILERPAYLTPSMPTFAEHRSELGWSFGFFTGICREGVSFAEGIDAAEGSQVAFLQGDPDTSGRDLKLQSVFGVDVIGLEVGRKYAVSWQQTARVSDAGQGALTVSVSPADGKTPPTVLEDRKDVIAQGEWETRRYEFVAKAESMRLNFRHHIPHPENANPNSETTLIDDVRIEKAR